MPTLRFRLLTPMLLAVVPAAMLPSAMAVAQSGAPAADALPPTPPPPPSRGLWAADSNHDGQLTREEVTAFLSARFAELDSDGDGRIPVATAAPMAATLRGSTRRATAIVAAPISAPFTGSLSCSLLIAPPSAAPTKRPIIAITFQTFRSRA